MPAKAAAPRAVLLDALGTLVELDDPVGGLVAALAAHGVDAAPREVAAALQAEIAYYRAEHHVAADLAGLEALRLDCARVFGRALGAPAAGLADAELRDILLAGLRFRAFDEVPAVLAALRGAGAAIAVVSNWDVSLHEVLEATRLRAAVDIVLTSAQERTSKPDPALFALALERLGGIAPGEAVHVGDDLEADVGGARRAGVAPLLLDRDGLHPPGARLPGGVPVIRSLRELPGAA